MQSECRLSIITINFNGYKDTCALIDSIPRSEEVEVVVVDNASRTDEASAIASRYPHVVVVRSSENLGFAGGNNLGIKASHGRFLFFLNNDTEIPPGQWKNVDRLIDRLQGSAGDPARKEEGSAGVPAPKEEGSAGVPARKESVGAVCPKIRFFWDRHPIQFACYTPLSSVTMRNRSIGFGEEDSGQYDTPHPTPFVHGAAMLVSREAMEKAGLMPECFFLYYEELDWSMMFRRAGYDLWYDPSMTIYHKESQTTGQASSLRTYYITRNRLLYARRNIPMPRRLLTYLYLIGLVAPRDVLKHLLHRHPDLRRATLRGIADFMKGRTGFRAF